MLLQVARQRGRARRPVRLAAQVFRGQPPSVARRPQPDHLADGGDVPSVPVEVFGLAAFDGARVSGRDRIDEDQVGVLEQGLLVVHQAVRRRQQRASVAHVDPPRTQQPKMQPDARRARAAVERERHRARLRVRAVKGIGDDEDLGLRLRAVEFVVLGFLGTQDDAPRRHRVGKRLAIDSDRVVGGDKIVLGLRGSIRGRLVTIIRWLAGTWTRGLLVGHGTRA